MFQVDLFLVRRRGWYFYQKMAVYTLPLSVFCHWSTATEGRWQVRCHIVKKGNFLGVSWAIWATACVKWCCLFSSVWTASFSAFPQKPPPFERQTIQDGLSQSCGLHSVQPVMRQHLCMYGKRGECPILQPEAQMSACTYSWKYLFCINSSRYVSVCVCCTVWGRQTIYLICVGSKV